MQIYVGNLPLKVNDEQLRAMFSPHGEVKSATVVQDKKTGTSEGYGFVEMPVKSEGRNAIEALRGKDMEGKPLLVRALKPGDDFHQSASTAHGPKGSGKSFGGNIPPRAGGAMRRGGQRGG